MTLDQIREAYHAAKTDIERSMLKMRFNCYMPLLGSPNPIPFYDPTILESITKRARETLNAHCHALMLDDEALPETDSVPRDRRLGVPDPIPGSRDRR